MRIGEAAWHRRAMRGEGLRVDRTTRSVRPILGVPCLLSRLTPSARHPSNDPTCCFDVAQDVIKRNGMVPLSATGIRSWQDDQPVHSGSRIGFDGVLVKWTCWCDGDFQSAQFGWSLMLLPRTPQALNVPSGLLQCEPKSVPAIAHHGGNREIRQEVLGSHAPALTVIITGIFDEKWLLEIEATAAA
jgi:hypothetical protein